MPLHPESPSGAGQLDRLDRAVGGMRGGDQVGPEAVHRLMRSCTELWRFAVLARPLVLLSADNKTSSSGRAPLLAGRLCADAYFCPTGR